MPGAGGALILASPGTKFCALSNTPQRAKRDQPHKITPIKITQGGRSLTATIDEATLDVLLRVAGLAPPMECRPGILANLGLLAQHGAILRRLDDPREDPAELIAP